MSTPEIKPRGHGHTMCSRQELKEHLVKDGGLTSDDVGVVEG